MLSNLYHKILFTDLIKKLSDTELFPVVRNKLFSGQGSLKKTRYPGFFSVFWEVGNHFLLGLDNQNFVYTLTVITKISGSPIKLMYRD